MVPENFYGIDSGCYGCPFMRSSWFSVSVTYSLNYELFDLSCRSHGREISSGPFKGTFVCLRTRFNYPNLRMTVKAIPLYRQIGLKLYLLGSYSYSFADGRNRSHIIIIVHAPVFFMIKYFSNWFHCGRNGKALEKIASYPTILFRILC